jgi:hypothetical protein
MTLELGELPGRQTRDISQMSRMLSCKPFVPAVPGMSAGKLSVIWIKTPEISNFEHGRTFSQIGGVQLSLGLRVISFSII